jgi:hypothetical protein
MIADYRNTTGLPNKEQERGTGANIGYGFVIITKMVLRSCNRNENVSS